VWIVGRNFPVAEAGDGRGHAELRRQDGPNPIAVEIWRGVARRLLDADQAVLAELPLASGRRADLIAIDRSGLISIVEIKSCRADFVADRKWYAYLDFCDRFYFAVGGDFPFGLLPPGEGAILADRYGGEIVREATLRPLSAPRRKAMLLRFARAAGQRLQALLDPDCNGRFMINR
jgi:hypothetical protein